MAAAMETGETGELCGIGNASPRACGPGLHLATLRRKAALELILPKHSCVPLGGSSADWC